jgi:hypothetical protein
MLSLAMFQNIRKHTAVLMTQGLIQALKYNIQVHTNPSHFFLDATFNFSKVMVGVMLNPLVNYLSTQNTHIKPTVQHMNYLRFYPVKFHFTKHADISEYANGIMPKTES